MSKPRQFCIYTVEGKMHHVDAPSLRKALNKFGGSPEEILAAVDVTCLPSPTSSDLPFLAVLLKNGNFSAPETPE